MGIKAIIFDFDGVICESVGAKTDAFKKLFEHYPDHLEEIIKVHMDYGGTSRFKKFEIIFRDILKKELTDEESERLGKDFTKYCYDEVVKCPYVKGAREFLEAHYQKLLLFVVSGTPEEELISIAQDRNLKHFFKGIYGSPRSKYELISLILNENQVAADEAVFVGDSINDLEGAQKAGIEFIGRVHEQYPNPFETLPEEQMIKNLEELEGHLQAKL